ncbi:MAG: DUF6263 family protein [Phycisphaerae bacterium]
MKLYRLTVLALLVCAPIAMAQKIELKQKYPAGHYKMTNTQQQVMQMTMNDQPMGNNKTSMTMVMNQEVSKPDADGKQTMKITYEKVRQVVSMMGQQMVYDSTDKSTHNSPMAAGLKPLIGKTIIVTIQNDQITDVKGMDEIWDAAAKAMPNGRQFAAQMKEAMGNDSMKSIMGMGGQMLPEKTVAPGDTWKVKQSLPFPMLGKISMTFDCKLNKIENNVAFVSYTGKMDVDTSDAKLPVPNAEIQKLDGDYTGMVKFDAKTGAMVGQTMDMDMKMNMAIQQGQNKMNMAVDGDIKQEVTIEEVK